MQDFDVVHPFKAANVFSGREREFKSGEIVSSESGLNSETVTIEIENSFFVIERSTLDACCKRRTDGGVPLV